MQIVTEVTGDDGTSVRSLEADFELTSSDQQAAELEVEVDNFKVHVTVKLLRGRVREQALATAVVPCLAEP